MLFGGGRFTKTLNQELNASEEGDIPVSTSLLMYDILYLGGNVFYGHFMAGFLSVFHNGGF